MVFANLPDRNKKLVTLEEKKKRIKLIVISAFLLFAVLFMVGFRFFNNKEAVVLCAQEAKLCPDGSYVGRTGPMCEFAVCPEINSLFSEAEARAIAERSCIKGGKALSTGIYDENSKTWQFDANLNTVKEGCDPVCVVNEETRGIAINWRCTGHTESTFANDYIEKAITDYLLTQSHFSWKTTEGSRNICAVENLGPKDSLFPLYVWAYCGEYIIREGETEMLSGVSVPVKINYPNELSYYDIKKFSYEAPGDGAAYPKDIEKIFPEDIQMKIISFNKEKIIQRAEMAALDALIADNSQ